MMNNAYNSNFNNFDLHQQMYWQQIDQAMLKEAQAAKSKALIGSIGTLVNDYFNNRIAINEDGELSAAGRERRLIDLNKRATKALDDMTGAFLKELDTEAIELEAALRRSANEPGDDMKRTLLKIESRAAASQIDPLLLRTQYLQLAESGADDLSMQAIEEAPAFAALLPADVLDTGRQIRAARLLPDQNEELRQIREMRSTLGAAVAQANRELALSFASTDDIARAAQADSFNPGI